MQTVASRQSVKEKKSTIKNYTTSSYQDSEWEIINSSSEQGFTLLDPEIIQTEIIREDPLFETFDRDSLGTTKAKALKAQSREKEEEIDLAIIEKKLAESYEKGKTVGFEAGKKEGQAEEQKKLKDLENKLNTFCLNIKKEIETFFCAVEKESVKLSLQVAKKLLNTTAQVKPDYIIDVIRMALKNLGAAHPVKIRVSRDDLEFIEVVGLPTELSAEELGVQYLADETIKSGCIIDTDFGEVDLRLDSMWEQVAEQISEVYK